MGWDEYNSQDNQTVNLYITKRPKMQDLYQLIDDEDTLQKVNHFPNAGYFSIKDQLYRSLKKQRAVFGNAYNFVPLTFNLPNDYSKFIDIFSKR